MEAIYDQLAQDYGAVTFEAFINLLVDITEDQLTPDQLREAFRGIANDKASHIVAAGSRFYSRLHSLSSRNSTCAWRTYLRARSSICAK